MLKQTLWEEKVSIGLKPSLHKARSDETHVDETKHIFCKPVSKLNIIPNHKAAVVLENVAQFTCSLTHVNCEQLIYLRALKKFQFFKTNF